MKKLLIVFFAATMILGCINGKVVKNGDQPVIHQIVDSGGANIIAWATKITASGFLKPVDGPEGAGILKVNGSCPLMVYDGYIRWSADVCEKPLSHWVAYQTVETFDWQPPTGEVPAINFWERQIWRHKEVPVIMTVAALGESNIILRFDIIGTAFSIEASAAPANVSAMLNDGWNLLE